MSTEDATNQEKTDVTPVRRTPKKLKPRGPGRPRLTEAEKRRRANARIIDKEKARRQAERGKRAALKRQADDAHSFQIPLTLSGKPAVLRDGNFVDPDTGEVISKARRTPSGRFVRTTLLSYEEAKRYLLTEKIPSRQQYMKWWDDNKPEQLSKWPHRTYEAEWLGWNDYLGNDNQFSSNVRWRPFPEARRLAIQTRCKTKEQWLDLGRAGGLPELVPSRPDLVYKQEWVNWKHWLDTEVVDLTAINTPTLDPHTQSDGNRPVFFVIRDPGRPANVLSVGIEPGGIIEMKARWERHQYELVKLFWYSDTEAAHITAALDATSGTMYGDPTLRICPNVWQTLDVLANIMEEVHLR